MESWEVVKNWVSAFSRGNADAVARFYMEDAINHQVVQEPIDGRVAIREMCAREFDRAAMVYQIKSVFQDGECAILEWTDPKELRGCDFFNIVDGRIVFQRGYFNELSFLRQQGLLRPAE